VTRRSPARCPTTEGVEDAAVGQDGDRVVLALPATVPYQNPVSEAPTAPGVVTITVRDRP